jgi:hypothetical protein
MLIFRKNKFHNREILFPLTPERGIFNTLLPKQRRRQEMEGMYL